MKSKLLLALLLFSVYCFGQDSSFQLKDFTFRTPGFKGLGVGIGLAGSASGYEKENGEDQSEKTFSITPSLISYFKLVSTDDRLHQTTLWLNPYGNFEKRTINGKLVKRNNLRSYFSWDQNDRFYKKNKWFFEIGNTLSNELSSQKNSDTVNNLNSSDIKVNNTVTLGIGKGRIERVQDAQVALYIINDLKAQGFLNAEPDRATVEKLARLITDINTKRVFDFRRRRIYELTRLDSFLRSSGLVTQTDIRHFTTVNDNWSLAFNPYRLSGSNWYVQLKPGADYTRRKYNEKTTANNYASTSDNFSFSLSPVAGYEKYVPLNLKWQLNMGISFAYQIIKNNSHYKNVFNGVESSNYNDYYDDLWTLNGFYSVGFFPNNRTQLAATLNLSALRRTNDYIEISPELNFTTNYFVSYRTYVTGAFNIAYNRTIDEANFIRNIDGHSFDTNLSVSISHVIF